MPAAVKTSKNRKFCATICSARKVSSLTKMTDAIEVPLIRLIVWLASAGRIARIACGRTIRRSVRNGGSPRAGGAHALAAFARDEPAADDFGGERRFIERKADHRGGEGAERQPDRRQHVE